MVLTLWDSLHCPGYGVPDDISKSHQEFLKSLFYKHKDRQGAMGEDAVHMSDITAEGTESTAEGRNWVLGVSAFGCCLIKAPPCPPHRYQDLGVNLCLFLKADRPR